MIEEASVSGGRVWVSEVCRSLRVCRAEYYRWRSSRGRVDGDGDLEVCEEIQRIAL